MKHKNPISNSIVPFAFTLILLCFPAAANMLIYPMETEVGLLGTAQIRVISKSDEVQFLNVTGKRILNPGTPLEKEIVVEETAENTLVFTPQKLALSAGSERIVRLVSMVPPEKETTWRVYFAGARNTLSQIPSSEVHQNGSTAQIGVNIVWGALVHVAPENIIASLRYDNNTGQVINNGTIRLPLREIGICDNAHTCRWEKETRTVYPDMGIHLPSVKAAPGNHYRVKYYHWIKKSLEEVEISAL